MPITYDLYMYFSGTSFPDFSCNINVFRIIVVQDNPDKSADMIGFDRIMLILAELIIPAGIMNFV